MHEPCAERVIEQALHPSLQQRRGQALELLPRRDRRSATFGSRIQRCFARAPSVRPVHPSRRGGSTSSSREETPVPADLHLDVEPGASGPVSLAMAMSGCHELQRSIREISVQTLSGGASMWITCLANAGALCSCIHAHASSATSEPSCVAYWPRSHVAAGALKNMRSLTV